VNRSLWLLISAVGLFVNADNTVDLKAKNYGQYTTTITEKRGDVKKERIYF